MRENGRLKILEEGDKKAEDERVLNQMSEVTIISDSKASDKRVTR